jgi:uncharacterized iron-regulated protein
MYYMDENDKKTYGEELSTLDALTEMEKSKVIIFGDNLENKHTQLMKSVMISHLLTRKGTLHVVLEHFNFEMQFLLDDFQAGKLSFKQLLSAYMFIGAEGYDADVMQYRSLLEYSRNNHERVKLHAGFLPWPYASIAVKKGE